MKPLTGKEFAKVVERFGWEYKRTTDSHHIYRKPGNPFNVSIPIHNSKQLKIGLQRHQMKIAGITEEDL